MKRWVAIGLLLWAPALVAQKSAEQGEWRHYGADLAGTKYSPLGQITAANFATLRLAWRWESADAQLVRADASGTWRAPAERIFALLEREDPKRWVTRPRLASLNATPLMIDGVLYINTPLSQAAAIDARTGRTLWVHDPKSYETGTPAVAPWRSRGVAYWTDGARARVLWGTGDGYLIAVDAKTGRLVTDFGTNGRVDLVAGVPRARRVKGAILPSSVQSPPIVVRDTVIVGSSMNDYTKTKEMPPGWVRAYDVRTGRHKWDFHTIPEFGEFGADTWKNDSYTYTGQANVWTTMSADEALGYVYLPTSTPTSDHYGGHRLGDGLFGESLVCVDVETGKRVWHFQMIHHGVWDYDNPAAPNLLDIVVDGRAIKAVAQVTKQGFVYAFDRVTGKPVWPIEERKVPVDTDIPGEVLSPTQPFPIKPPAFEYQGTSIDDLVDFTPELREKAIEAVKGLRLGPLYTPNMLNGTVIRPAVIGGANWGGAAVDPMTGMLYVPSKNLSSVIRYREPKPDEGSTFRLISLQSIQAPTLGDGLPLWKPPYSRMTAINMNRGDHAWMVPLGKGDRIRNHPMLKPLNLPPLGGDGGGFGANNGPVLTSSLLIMALALGGTNDGPRLVAYDKTTGKEVGSVDLPGAPLGTPMTYMADGKQYVAVTVGGPVPELVAFSLP